MDMALDTGVDYAADLGQRLETILRPGHLFQNVFASDNANVHNGDRIYVTYNVTYNKTSSDGFLPVATDQLLQDATSDITVQSRSTPKRKRAVDDCGGRHRESRQNDYAPLETALSNLGDLSIVIERFEQGEEGRKIAAYLSSVLDTMRQIEHNHPLPDDSSFQVDDIVHQLERTRCVKLNRAFPQRQVALLSRQDSNVVGVDTGHWRISLNTIVVNTQHPYASQACSVLHAQPLGNSGGFHVAALFSRMSDMENVTNAHPVVLAYDVTHLLCRGFITYRTGAPCSRCLERFGKKNKSQLPHTTGCKQDGSKTIHAGSETTLTSIIDQCVIRKGRRIRHRSQSHPRLRLLAPSLQHRIFHISRHLTYFGQ
jgi:hypothetical protein